MPLPCTRVSKSVLISEPCAARRAPAKQISFNFRAMYGPPRPGEASRTILEKNPVKLEENWSGEKSGESGEFFFSYAQGPAGGPVLVITELVRANQGLSNCSGFYAAALAAQIQARYKYYNCFCCATCLESSSQGRLIVLNLLIRSSMFRHRQPQTGLHGFPAFF